MVFLNAKIDGEHSEAPPPVLAAFKTKKMGNVIPKAVVAAPDMSRAWYLLNHDELGESKSYREAKRAVRDIQSGEAQPPEPEAGEMLEWGVKGKNGFYTGSYQGVTDKDEVLLKNPKGDTFPIALEKLGTGSVNYARSLSGKDAPAPAETETAAPVAPALESWESADGKKIEAKFLSLKDDKVSLENADGKVFSFPLVRLSEASQARARELAK